MTAPALRPPRPDKLKWVRQSIGSWWVYRPGEFVPAAFIRRHSKGTWAGMVTARDFDSDQVIEIGAATLNQARAAMELEL